VHHISAGQRKSVNHFMIKHMSRQRRRKVEFCGLAVFDLLQCRAAFGAITCGKVSEPGFSHGHADLFKCHAPPHFFASGWQVFCQTIRHDGYQNERNQRHRCDAASGHAISRPRLTLLT
jgi:hypothetical protein